MKKTQAKKPSAKKPTQKTSAAGYVDGFVLIVPKAKVSAYKKMAKEASAIWMKNGALNYKECMLNDAKPENITFTFPIMAKAKANETVWFSYIEYKSKAHRDAVNKKVMKMMEEMYSEEDMKNMPFDMKRTANGGFKVEVSG